jgi:predicted aldo/keto reductase-like oxidoreductase
MQYSEIGNTGVKISRIAMGGHEYLPNGKSRGFNEDMALATTPGYIFPGFGGEARKAVLRMALEHGVNFFDVTQDSEKEAIGRNLQEIDLPYEIYIQTRPEGMVYTYDPYNAQMAVYEKLRDEALRILKLLRRERIDFFNIAFMKDAWKHDPEYFEKMADNIARLKKEGLIRFACADTFSGEETYLRQIESGAYDVIYVNFNFADDKAAGKVFAACREKGMGVITREAFMKGALYHFADEAGITDKTALTHAAAKWVFSHGEVSAMVYGSGKAHHVEDILTLVDDLEMTDTEAALIERIRATEGFRKYQSDKDREFMQ